MLTTPFQKFQILALLVSSSASLHAVATYSLNGGQTNLASGVAVWDVVDGDYTGTMTLISSNAPNLLSVSSNSLSFDYNIHVLSEFDFVYEADTSGGAPASEVESMTVFIERTRGAEFYFEDVGSSFVVGQAAYSNSGNLIGLVTPEDSGTSDFNSFQVAAGGSEWELEGTGPSETLDSVGWTMSFTSVLTDPFTGEPFVQPASMGAVLTLAAVPEPSASLLLGAGFLALLVRRKR